MSEETITIPRLMYDMLLDAEKKLIRLEAYGVDNWEQYGDAVSDKMNLFTEEGE